MSEVQLPFQPGTISIDVLRRPVFLLGGMSAVLLQVADPRVAAGVAEHSDFANAPFPRMRHTIELMMDIGLGEPEQAERARRVMENAHRRIRGQMPDGVCYDAADPELRLWVLSTLITTVLEVEEKYCGEFDEEDRSRYYQESRAVGRMLGVGDTPGSLSEFRSYYRDRLSGLEVSPRARDIAHHVLYPRFGLLPPAVFAPLRLVTADLLPQRIREAYGLALSYRGQRLLRAAQGAGRVVIPRLPDWLRTFPVLRPVAGVRDRISSSRRLPGAGAVSTRRVPTDRSSLSLAPRRRGRPPSPG